MRQGPLRAQRQKLVALAALLALPACSRCGEEAKSEPAPTSASSAQVSPSIALAASSAPPAAAKEGPPFNVILITVDSLRADMPWAGYDRPIAPRLQKLYDSSVRFTHAYSTSSFTSKSIPGLLTGKYPSELARTGAFFSKYVEPRDFFCTHLNAAAIPCIGAHAHMYFDRGQSGFETGFQTWKIVPGIKFDYQTDPFVTSDKLTPLAIEVLGAEAPKDKPFLAWFHYMDPHDQYQGHDESPHFGKRARDLYDEEVFFTDLWIGKLLDWVDAQPWAKRTAIVLTADHGEAFGEHGMTRHAHELWEELIHVPLFFRVPGAAPRTIERPRGHADLAPTFLELLGLDPQKSITPPLRGTSLLKEITTGEGEDRDVIADLPEDDYNERRRALIHGRKKLIAFGEDQRFSVFDLETDPKEETDLVRKDPELTADLRGRYREVNKTISSVAPRGGIPKKNK